MTSNLLIENCTATHESARGIFPIKVSLVPGRKRIAVLRPRVGLDFSTYRDLIAEARGVYDVGMCGLVLDLCETPSISSSGLVALHNIVVSLSVDTERAAIGIAEVNERVRKMERRLARLENTGQQTK